VRCNSDYDAALKLDAQASLTYNARGLLLESQGDLKGALEDYKQAVALGPDQIAFVRNRGLCHRAVGDVESAVEDLNMCVACVLAKVLRMEECALGQTRPHQRAASQGSGFNLDCSLRLQGHCQSSKGPDSANESCVLLEKTEQAG
jgi:tetratricopeptide (TPR) repeat protein